MLEIFKENLDVEETSEYRLVGRMSPLYVGKIEPKREGENALV